MIGPIQRVIIFVGNVEKCTAFYRDVLGFAPVQDADGRPEQWQELDAGGCKLALHKAYGPDGPIDKPTGGPGNPHKIVLYVDDVAAARRTLVDRGVPMDQVHTSGDLVLCDGWDPEGHRFQICNRR